PGTRGRGGVVRRVRGAGGVLQSLLLRDTPTPRASAVGRLLAVRGLGPPARGAPRRFGAALGVAGRRRVRASARPSFRRARERSRSPRSLARLGPRFLGILRIAAAWVFVQIGTAQLFAYPAAVLPGDGTAGIRSLRGVAGILETVGGVLLLVGLFARPVAFLLSGQMAVAYFIGHAPQGFGPVLNQGIPAVLFCFVFCFVWLYLSAAGPRPWSLDTRRRAAVR
ncbi:MAG TPA: DoxX family protein, partial [Thermodesulfobacteriota bacterium]|nr:DoxX family protein [Thermodesulfobacteriota bacterium]